MSLLIKIICSICGNEFVADPKTMGALGLRHVPKKCPACCDKQQGRALEAMAVSRYCLQEFPAVAIHLPEKLFAPFQARQSDRSVLRAVIKGNSLPGWGGVSWDGRLDVFCLAETVPSVARVRVMEVTHAAGQHRVEKHGTPMGPKNEVEVEYDPTHTYLALEPSEENPSAALILVSVDYKTTLKGFGRQWHARLDAVGALWATELSRSARSGRFGVYGAVAVVDDDHPVVVEQTGAIKRRLIYHCSNPGGLEI